jgi:hypothetical protein
MADKRYTLDLQLEGPFAICHDSDEDDCVRILAPDLLDSHFMPGFVATDNGVDLESGMFSLEIIPSAKRKMVLCNSKITMDRVECKRRKDPGAYLILDVPKPDEVCLISGTDATIVSPVGAMAAHYCTRVVLRYYSVTGVTVHGALVNQDSGGDSLPLVMTPLGNEAVLVFDMKPKQAPGREHAMMAYRAMTGMVGIARYMTPGGGRSLLRTAHNDCKAALIFAVPPNSRTWKQKHAERLS